MPLPRCPSSSRLARRERWAAEIHRTSIPQSPSSRNFLGVAMLCQKNFPVGAQKTTGKKLVDGRAVGGTPKSAVPKAKGKGKS